MKNSLAVIAFAMLFFACKSTHKSVVTDNNFIATDNYNALSQEDKTVFDAVQRQTFEYFWSGAEPNSGMARERFHEDNIYPQNDKHVVTVGGGGFGIMSILSGINQKYITREQGRKRLQQITDFLEKADRFYGAWPHWLNGETGKVVPFGKYDNGGDLVETSFMLTGLLCVREYFKNGNAAEKKLAKQCDKLWREVDFNWYRNGGKDVLYWHWSPEYAWKMNFPVTGYNECMIMYVLGAASPTHSVPASVYHNGWARSGAIVNPVTKFGYTLQLSHNYAEEYGGPLFWSHYSYLGLDPRKLKDKYADYWKENVSQSKINYEWCAENPLKYKGYGKDSWGLTSSYSVKGYSGHAPGKEHNSTIDKDLGVISPTAALSSINYTPEESMNAMRNWYNNKRSDIWGNYGFYDAFSDTEKWYPKRYLAIDQGPIVVMLENYRSEMFWKLFMGCDEVQKGLKDLGFSSPYLK